MTPWEEENQRKEAEKAVKLQWLRSLRPGHKVAVQKSRGTDYEIYEVARVTPTQIVVKFNGRLDYRYRKTDGARIGGSSASSFYWQNGIEPVTPKIMEAIELKELREWLFDLGDKNRNGKLSLKTLRALKAAIEPIIAADGDEDAA
jgi:hypothetical protein